MLKHILRILPKVRWENILQYAKFNVILSLNSNDIMELNPNYTQILLKFDRVNNKYVPIQQAEFELNFIYLVFNKICQMNILIQQAKFEVTSHMAKFSQLNT